VKEAEATKDAESTPNFNPRGRDVWSTSRNYLLSLRKRVADGKHGIEFRSLRRDGYAADL
jgi:hypothetical protein